MTFFYLPATGVYLILCPFKEYGIYGRNRFCFFSDQSYTNENKNEDKTNFLHLNYNFIVIKETFLVFHSHYLNVLGKFGITTFVKCI